MLTSRQGKGLTSADLSVIFAQGVVKKKAKNKSLAKRSNPTLMTYGDFLDVLMSCAPKVYPDADASEVFQKLLLENVLPLAARRAPTDISVYLEDDGVSKILGERLGEGLSGIFEYYTDLSDRRRKKVAAQEVSEMAKLRGGHGQVVTTNKAKAKRLRDLKDHLGYPEFIQLCQDFKLIALSQITTIQAGDIFLSSCGAHHGGDSAKDLTLDEFRSLLVRIAVTAYEGAHESIDIPTKVKGLMLFLWKAVNTADATEKAVNGRGNKSVCDASKSVKSGDLNLFGSSIFNVKMLDLWREDGFREYLEPVPVVEEDGETVLKRMLNTGSMDFMADLKAGLESSEGGSPSVVSSTVKTSALGELLKQRPHIADLLHDSLTETDN